MSVPSAARKFDRPSDCRRVPDQHAHVRAIRPRGPTLCPRRVSLPVRDVSPSPENFLATQADKNANVLFPAGPRRDRAAPAAVRKIPESNPVLLRACSRFASQIRRAATNKCGRVFRAPDRQPLIDLGRSTPRSNGWWQTRWLRFVRQRPDQLRSETSPDHQQARCNPSKESRQNQAWRWFTRMLRNFPVYESAFERFNYAVTQQKKIFGTDGVRGVANVEPVTAETALKLGRAAAFVFAELNPRRTPASARPKIVLGKDTRLSGYMLENALVAGITSLGVDVLIIGPLPTPGVAYITRSLRADAGIVLSASHNAYEDNGIKFFRHDGNKLDDQVEEKIEQLVFTGEIDSIRPTANKIGRATRIDDALGRYVEFAKASFPRGMSLEEMRVAVDVANGAAYKSTPCVLRELGADVVVAHNQPNGMNINDGCGSTHPEEIQRIVEISSADVGITHDGDADRVLLCDENGDIVDGDEILAIAALDLLNAGRLTQNTVVATVMSNFGLDETLAAKGGKVIRTKVGDRYVIEEMVQRKLNLGGEQSGHIIFRDFTTTGDGIISALQILRIMHKTGQPLGKLKTCLKKYPQAQRNLPVKEKPPLSELSTVMKLVNEAEKELSGKGRVLLRYSGTEPKIRLLIEGRELDQIDKQANRIADAIQSAIGVN